MNINQLQNISDAFPRTEKMPVLFLGHGSPMNAIEENQFVRGFREVSKKIPIDKIFLETDDADFDIAELYQKVSEIKEISLEELQKKISENLQSINVKFSL